MKEGNREGVANHPGPEPCEGGREWRIHPDKNRRDVCGTPRFVSN